MPYSLIIAEKPDHGWPETMHRALQDTELPEGVVKMSENAWLIHVDNSLLYHARLITILHDAKILHHVSFFDTKPTFIRSVTKE